MSPRNEPRTADRKPHQIDHPEVWLAIAAALPVVALVLWLAFPEVPATDPEPLHTTTTSTTVELSDADKLWLHHQCYGPNPTAPFTTLPTCPEEPPTP